MDYILLIVGFIILIKGADIFVDGSIVISEHFGIPAFIIGLTIVAMGTSAPEAAVSVTAALHGSNGIAVGNVIGSNIFNLLMVLGVSALIKPLPVQRRILKVEYPFSLIATVMLPVLASNFLLSRSNFILTRIDGLILLTLFAIFIWITISSAKASGNPFTEKSSSRPKLGKGIIFAVIGVIGIILGGKIVVYTASHIAETFGISQNLIGLTIVAIGTSLPELMTSAVASYKGQTDIAVGNVIGSNIFNLLFVLGLSVLVDPISVDPTSIHDSIILFAITIIVMIPALIKKEIRRPWGASFILIYIVYTAYIIMR